jgi:hypothetical protein
MSCCTIQASRALLIGHEYVISEVVVHCLSIAQRAPILEWEPRFIPLVRPCGRTVLKSKMRWSVTWWREATFYRCRPVDRWVLTGGIEPFLIATLNHANSLGFIVRISPRANPKDWVVIDGVPIGSRNGLSIRFIIAGYLMTAWNVVTKFLRPRWNLKLIVIMHRSSCSWVGCSRLSSSPATNGSVLNMNYVPAENLLS